MSPRKRGRAFSAGHLDRGEMTLLSRPASRSFLTKEWITSMRQKGIIISDAEMRYRKWLSLSNKQNPGLSSVVERSVPERPLTAPPATIYRFRNEFRENKCSKLRQKNLPEPHAEINHAKLLQQKRKFEKQCRCFSPSVIKTGSFPEEADNSPHQFLNPINSHVSSHIIDSRSLSRLGVYIPRSNLGRTFINPAGILPKSTAYYGRVGSAVSPTPAAVMHVPKSSLLLEVQTCIEDKSSISCSSLNSSMDCHMEKGTDAGNPLIVEEGIVTIEKSPELLPNDNDNDELSSVKHTANEISIRVIPTEQQDNILDEQLLVSTEASNLAKQIIEDSLVNDSDDESNALLAEAVSQKDISSGDNKSSVVLEKSNNTSVTETEKIVPIIVDPPPPVEDDVEGPAVNDMNSTVSEASVMKSSSTLVVDMTQLHINS